MVELKEEYPYKDWNGVLKDNLIRHYAEDKDGVRYYIIQIETGIEYTEAVDLYPCRYTYKVTDKKIEVEDGESKENS